MHVHDRADVGRMHACGVEQAAGSRDREIGLARVERHVEIAAAARVRDRRGPLRRVVALGGWSLDIDGQARRLVGHRVDADPEIA